jgi:hypothetical protein
MTTTSKSEISHQWSPPRRQQEEIRDIPSPDSAPPDVSVEDQVDWEDFWDGPEWSLGVARDDAILGNSEEVPGNQISVGFDLISEFSEGSSRGIYQDSGHRHGSDNEVRAFEQAH